MQINIDLLDLRTVDKAIKQIEQYQNRVRELIPEYLKRCAEAVSGMANEIVATLPYESELKALIQSSWSVKETENGVVLENAYDKAVYVEFGTGIVGSNDAHEKASESGYKYDVKNHGQKGWRFTRHVDDWEPLDLPNGSYTIKTLGHTGMWFDIRTQGAPATMLLYNAAMNFLEDKVYERIWQRMAKDL